jgi:DNA-binding NarL/FixJ family response regulator
MRCLIVDDSVAFRQAASSLLEGSGISVVGTANTTVEAIDCSRNLSPDLVLVDIDLGAESGFDAAAALHRAVSPPPTIILISTHDEVEFADLVAASPAVGFLPKMALSPESIRRLLAQSAS